LREFCLRSVEPQYGSNVSGAAKKTQLAKRTLSAESLKSAKKRAELIAINMRSCFLKKDYGMNYR